MSSHPSQTIIYFFSNQINFKIRRLQDSNPYLPERQSGVLPFETKPLLAGRIELPSFDFQSNDLPLNYA